MTTRRVLVLVLLAVMAGFLAGPGVGQQAKGDARDKEAIAQNAQAFIEAFAKGDAKTLAAFWTPDGDYTEQTGRHFKGREAIEKAFDKFFTQNKNLTVRIESESLRFVSPAVAIEDGITFVIHPDGFPASRARYTIVHVKKDDKWYLSSVRDSQYVAPNNYEHLEGLEWAIGTWSSENEKGHAEHLEVEWNDNQNWIVANFSASVRGLSVGSATHWIGWDPRTKHVRSWLFDAAGGFGEGTWTKDGNNWVIKIKSVQRDGKDAGATIRLGRVNDHTISLQATGRIVDGKPAPDTPQFKLKRVK
jgi:uncharacterized protein (TIGR02246 family)